MYNENDKNGMGMPDNSIPDMGNNTAAEKESGSIHIPIREEKQQSVQGQESINHTEPGQSGTVSQTGTASSYGAPGQMGTVSQSGTASQTGAASSYGAAGQTGTVSQSGTAGQTGVAGSYGAAGQAGPASQSGAAGQAGPANSYGAAGQSGTVNQYGAAGQAGTASQSGAAGQAGSANSYVAAGQSGTVNQYGPAGQTGTASSYRAAGQSGTVNQYGAAGQTGTASSYGAARQSEAASEYGTAGQTGSASPYGAAGQLGSAGQYGTAGQSDATRSGQQANNYGWQQRTPQPIGTGHNSKKSVHKKSSIGKKIAGITAAALLFGTVAGGTMAGINAAADRFTQESSQTGTSESRGDVAAAETQPEITAPASVPQVSSALAMDVSDIVEKAMPSVVAINNTMIYESQNWFGQRQTYEVPSSGSGIIVGENDEELLIVTNNHVVEGSKTLEVTFIDNKSVEASIKGTDSETDLAVIAVPLSGVESDTMSRIQIATLGDSDSLKVGQGVIAIGNALGYGQSVTVGYVSAIDREVKTENNVTRNLLQTDAAINPGNSGGALLNMKGEVIGINAAKYSSTEVEGMGYAIPISSANEIISELMSKRTRVEVAQENQGYLGIQGQNIDEASAEMYGMPRGIFVYKIVEDGAAAASDLKEKDIITKFDGQTVRTMADLKSMLTYYEGGSTVTLTVQTLQDGEYVERIVDITLDKRPQGEVN